MNLPNVLIADDDRISFVVLKKVLGESCITTYAKDGQTALKLISKQKFDLVLLDIMMPGMNGYEVCERIKANEQTKKVPVIFISTLSSKEDEGRALRVGGLDLIQKPTLVDKISTSMFQTRVNNAMQVGVLTQSQIALLTAKDAAERASLAKSSFLASMSHDIRTPLNAIGPNARNIMDETADDKTLADIHEMAAEIYDAANGLNRMLSDLLDISKIESGKMRFRMEEIDLFELAENTAKMFERWASETDQTIEINKPLFDLLIIGDREKIGRIFQNLLSNAIKFNTSGEKIEITFSEEDLNGSSGIKISVRDHGRGIPPKELALIFERYQQLSRMQPSGGTGLGLDLAKGFVEGHNGTIHAKNHPDGGAIFIVWLPMDQKLQYKGGIES